MKHNLSRNTMATHHIAELEIIDLENHPSPEALSHYANSVKNKCNGECKQSCPLGIDIPQVIKSLSEKDIHKARDILDKENPFPSLCGRFCQAPCQQACPCSVQFKAIERFLGDHYEPSSVKVKLGKPKVTIIGAGLSGLTVAWGLHRKGISAKLLEATERPGGMICRAIPEFRLPSKIANQEVRRLTNTLEVVTHTIGGTTFPVEELSKQYLAVVIATGANKPTFLGIPGEHLTNVQSAVDFLSNQTKKSTDNTVVIGGTTHAVDAARHAKRLGDTVTIMYPRQDVDMPAEQGSVLAAKKEGVKFLTLTHPQKIVGSRQVEGIECVPMMLEESEIGESKIPTPMEGNEFIIPCTKVIIGVGLEPNPTMGRYTSLRTVGKGRVWTNEHHQTSIPNVFAAGEIAIGSSRIEKTIAHAKHCTTQVNDYLHGKIKEEG